MKALPGILAMSVIFGSAALMVGCSKTDKVEYAVKDSTLESKASSTKAMFLDKDSSLQEFFDDAAGYAVFPSVGKFGVIVGGSHGKGVVYEDGNVVGYAAVTKATIGAQLGGQSFSQIIFFQTDANLDRFKAEKWEGSADASAVIGQSGSAATNRYRNGIAVFLTGPEGVMLEAAVGGQKFNYLQLQK